MNKIKFITDSTSDLSKELYEQNDIDVIPLIVSIGGNSYQDNVTITTEEIYKLVEKHNELPKSAAVSPAVFEEAFSKYINDGYDIIYMGIGSGFSGSFNNARIASENFDENRIFLVDSKNLSSGIGLLLLKAIDYKNKGLSAKEIVEKIENITNLVRTQFAINTLDFLHKGGRCSGTAKIFGTLLKIKPIIRVVDGKMDVAKKPRGKFTIALNTLLEYFDSDINNVDQTRVFITHSFAEEDAKYLREQLNERGFNNILETRAGATISTHCGPRTIGILYLLNE